MCADGLVLNHPYHQSRCFLWMRCCCGEQPYKSTENKKKNLSLISSFRHHYKRPKFLPLMQMYPFIFINFFFSIEIIPHKIRGRMPTHIQNSFTSRSDIRFRVLILIKCSYLLIPNIYMYTYMLQHIEKEVFLY